MCWPVYPAGRFQTAAQHAQGDLPKPAGGTKLADGASSGCGLRDRLWPDTMPGTSLIPSPDLSPACSRTHLSRGVLEESRPAILQTPCFRHRPPAARQHADTPHIARSGPGPIVPVLEKLLGALTIERWDARHIGGAFMCVGLAEPAPGG